MAVVAHFKPYSNMKDCGKIVVAIWSSFAALFLAFFGLAFKYNSKYTLSRKLDPESCSSAAFIASAMYAVIATISISMCCKQTCRAWQYARQIHPRRYWSMKDGSKQERELLLSTESDPIVPGKSKVV